MIARVQRGDVNAYAILVHAYKDKALSLAIGLLKDQYDAEDALQEAFVRAFRGLGSFRGSAQFGTWFYRIVYNTCLNVLDKRQRIPHMEEMDETSVPVWIEPDLFEALEPDMIERILREELERMPPLYAAVMDLFYVQEYSHEQIMQITGAPLGTIKTRLHRGRALLRDAMTARCPELLESRGGR